MCNIFQDVQLVHYTADQFARNKVLASARKSLRQHDIVGLHQAPCLKALLQKLPLILQEQYLFEKVCSQFCDSPTETTLSDYLNKGYLTSMRRGHANTVSCPSLIVLCVCSRML